MHKYSFIIIHFGKYVFSDKNQDNGKLSFIEYNVT